jgi:hypothetical protein
MSRLELLLCSEPAEEYVLCSEPADGGHKKCRRVKYDVSWPQFPLHCHLDPNIGRQPARSNLLIHNDGLSTGFRTFIVHQASDSRLKINLGYINLSAS